MKYVVHVLLFVIMFSCIGYTQEEKKGLDPKVLDQWQSTMDYGISDQRLKTMKSIYQSKSQEAYFLIEKALISDLNSGVRGEAAYTLINLKIDEESIWSTALKNEKDTEVLRKVVFGIGELKISSLGSGLMDVLSNYIDEAKENYLLAATIRSLGNIKYKAAGNYIYTLLTNYTLDPEIRSASAVAIGDLGSTAELDQIEFIVDNPGEDKAVRMYSAFALGKSGNKKYIDLLFRIISNEKEDINVRLMSIAGLEYIIDPGVEDKLIELCKVDHKSVRAQAIKTLGKLKSIKAQKILTYKAKNDPIPEIRLAAKKALKEMDIDLDKIAEEEKKKKTELDKD